MTHVQRTLRLYLTNRTWVLFTPMYILGVMLLLTLAIAGILGIWLGFPISANGLDGMRFNGGALYSVPGFLMSVGVLAMTRNFDMALAFGATRRNFWIGTALGFTLSSLAVGGISVVLLGVEKLTNHWFIGARAFDVIPLGSGNVIRTFITMFLTSLLALFLGAFFGMVYRAYGTVWTSVAAVGLSLLTLAGVAGVSWQWVRVEPLWAALGGWLILGAAAVVTVAAAGASYAVNRVATI